MSALGDIPTTLCTALEHWRIFRKDESLKKAVRRLYEDSMNAIRELVDILNHKPDSTSTRDKLAFNLKKAVPGREAEMIDQILKAVMAAEKNVNTNIDRIVRETTVETHYHVVATHEVLMDFPAQLQTAEATFSATLKQEFSGMRQELAIMKEEFQKSLMCGPMLIPSPMMEFLQHEEVMQTSFYHLNGEQVWKRGDCHILSLLKSSFFILNRC